MSPPPHRIRSQRWLLRAGSSAQAFIMRQRLREEWEGTLLPVFEEAFDQLARGDEVIRIPRIELHLKVSSEDRIPGELPELIHQQLVAQLREFGSAASRWRGEMTAHVERSGETLSGKPSSQRTAVETWKTSSARQDRFGRLMRYLQTGSAAWEAIHLNAGAFAGELKETCREQASELRDRILSERGPPAFYFRLFQLIAPAEAVVLARTLLDTLPQPWKTPLAELLAVLLESGERHFSRHIQLEVAAAILVMALTEQDSITAPDFATAVERVSAARGVAWDEVAVLAPAAAAAVRDYRTDMANPVSSADGTRESTGAAPSLSLALPAAVAEEPGELSLRNGQPFHVPGAPEDFPLLVTGAGLVLLHPFLARFFETLRVKEPGQRELSSLPHAAALLHLLATGREDIFEYELALIKVLLGLEPETPLQVAEGLITEPDRDEAGALLQAAIAHWPVLKQTSPAGLQQSFLNRQGLLRNADDGWRLQVERTGYDVLLDQLPWAIGIVKLPWMKRPLHTEW